MRDSFSPGFKTFFRPSMCSSNPISVRTVFSTSAFVYEALTSHLWQVYGLDLRTILSAGRALSRAVPDVGRFRRLQSLHLDGVDNRLLAGNSWRLTLPNSLRVLHLDWIGAKDLQVCIAVAHTALH